VTTRMWIVSHMEWIGCVREIIGKRVLKLKGHMETTQCMCFFLMIFSSLFHETYIDELNEHSARVQEMDIFDYATSFYADETRRVLPESMVVPFRYCYKWSKLSLDICF
jgi:hypothetical protein